MYESGDRSRHQSEVYYRLIANASTHSSPEFPKDRREARCLPARVERLRVTP